MKNAKQIRKRLDTIHTLDTTEAISLLSELWFESGMEACAEREELRKDILEVTKQYDGLYRTLKGNGNSLDNRVKSVEACVNEFSKELDEIKLFLVGGLGQKEPSIKEQLTEQNNRLKPVEKHVATIEKIAWFLVTTITGYIVLQVLNII